MSSMAILHVCTPNIRAEQLQSVLNAAEALGGHLSVVVVGQSAVPPIGAHVESVSVPWMKERQSDQRKINDKVVELEKLLAASSVPHHVGSAYTELFNVDNEIEHRARLSDLILVGADILGDLDTLAAVLDGAWFHAKTPVLFDPHASLNLENSTVMIAWQDTLEASSAVKSSMPILKLAGSVKIVVVDENPGMGDPSQTLSSYLSLHGIENLQIDVLESNGRKVSDVLNDHSKQIDADLVVMGAYSHTRFYEWMFGGVTRAAIQSPARPTFMAR